MKDSVANGFVFKNSNLRGIAEKRAFSFRRKIQALIKWHIILKDPILNFNQTLLSYITAGNSTLKSEGPRPVAVMGKGKGKQINLYSCCYRPFFTDAVNVC